MHGFKTLILIVFHTLVVLEATSQVESFPGFSFELENPEFFISDTDIETNEGL